MNAIAAASITALVSLVLAALLARARRPALVPVPVPAPQARRSGAPGRTGRA